MAVDWYLMDQPPIYNGGFEGEEFFAYAQDGFKEMLDTTMLCDNVEFINSDFSVITPGKAIIQSVTPDTQFYNKLSSLVVTDSEKKMIAIMCSDSERYPDVNIADMPSYMIAEIEKISGLDLD